MKREVGVILVVGIVFAIIVFAAITVGLGYTGAAAMSATIGSLAGLGVFFGVMLSLERVIDQVEINRHTSQIDDLVKVRREKSRSAKNAIEDLYSTPNSIFEVLGNTLKKVLAPGAKVNFLRMKMLSAGYTGEASVVVYLSLKLFMPILGGFVGTGAAYKWFAADTTTALLGFAIGALAFYLSVDMILNSRIKERWATIKREMPDVLDLLVIYTESGVSFDSALQRTIISLSKRCPKAMAELAILERELRMFTDRFKAYENLNKRVELSLMKNFSAILVQSEKIGSPISRSLRQLGLEARRERILEAEKKAARIPILMQLPILLFILPSLMMIVLGPTIIKLIDAFGTMVK